MEEGVWVGARDAGCRASFILAADGSRPALRWLQGMQALTTFCHEWAPPLDLGMMWSSVRVRVSRPQYWHL